MARAKETPPFFKYAHAVGCFTCPLFFLFSLSQAHTPQYPILCKSYQIEGLSAAVVARAQHGRRLAVCCMMQTEVVHSEDSLSAGQHPRKRGVAVHM